MRVLVVGASGVLGRALVPLLVAAGHDVRPASRQTGVDLLTSDLGLVVDGCEAVVHAATAIPSRPNDVGAWDLNTQLRTVGTRRLLAAAQADGVQCYIQQSIVLAYANGGDAWLDEDSPFDSSPERAEIVDPVREMESLVRSSRLNWRILRGGEFVGPGTFQDTLLRQLASGRLRIPGDGSHWISPIHPEDMAAAIVFALPEPYVRPPQPAADPSPPAGQSRNATSHNVFNIVAEPIRYGDYVDRLADFLEVAHPERDASRPRPPSRRCTAARAHQELAWRPSHSIWPTPRYTQPSA